MHEPLPEPFGAEPFSVHDAVAAKVGRGRLRGSDLTAPFRGVRSPPVASFEDLVRGYTPAMAPDHAFGGITAARLWGLPIAARWTLAEPLVLARPKGIARGVQLGTRHIAYAKGRLETTAHLGLRILDPLSTALTLARELDHEAVVQVLDALLTPSRNYPGLLLPRAAKRAHASPAELTAFIARCRGLGGAPMLRAAAVDARVGVDSRFETITRLLIVEAGLPEPVVHPTLVIDGATCRPDLGYPDLKIAIEYEGDGHRDKQQWHVDIDRYARLEAAGWISVRVTSDHMARRGAHFVARVRAALARRGA